LGVTKQFKKTINKMKDFFNLKNLKMFLGLTTGFIIYDYFAHEQIDWIRAIIIAILTVIIVVIFNRLKKSKN